MPETFKPEPATAQDNPVTAATSIDVVREYFDLIDSNVDEYLSAKEVKEAARLLVGLTDEQRVAMQAFAPAVALAEEINDDEYGFENNGVSKQDLLILDNEQFRYKDITKKISELLPDQDVRDKRVFGAQLNASFDTIDVNKDGTLSKFEIQHFRDTPTHSQSERTIAGVLVEHFDEFKSITNEKGLKNRSAEGPFLDGWKGDENITRHDAQTFDSLLARAENFEKYIRRHRTKEIGTGIGGALMYAGLTALSGVVTLGDPEPVSKAILGLVTASLAGVTGANFYRAIHGETRTIRDQYQERKQMLDSWKFFNA